MKVHILKSSAASRIAVRPILGRLSLIQLIFGLITALWLIFFPQNAHGQDSPITARVNQTNFSTDELVILTVVVVDNSAEQPRPILPGLDGLAVVDLDISTEVGVVNGEIHTEVTYTYRLQPRRTGLLTIPPVTVKIDDQIFKAAPISITVDQGAPPAPSSGNAVQPANISPPADLNGQDFFIEAQVTPAEPYLGQQVIYTFRFYQAIQVYRQPQYEGPLFDDFETLGLPVREYNFDIAGRTYLISEIRTALFPKTSGNIVIGPARLMFPGNIYEDPLELYTEPVTVAVKPLPADAPPQFNGAIGQYEIKAWFSPQVAVLNQPSTFYVAISGTGNIQELPEPTWPELTGWRTYDSLSSLTTDTQEDGLIAGTRVYERLMVSDQMGDFVIPPAMLIYFDPVAAEYRTISTNPLSVTVIPAPTPAPTVAIVTTPAGALAAQATPAPVEQPVNPVLTGSPGSTWQVPLPFMAFLVAGLCGAIPAAAALGAGGVWLWQRQAASGHGRKKEEGLRQPSQKIHPVLSATMKETGDNYKAVGQALNSYLSAALKTSVKGLTRTDLAHRLRQQGLEQRLIERVENCLAQSEMGRYGPATEDAGWSLMAETDELLRELDKAFRLNDPGRPVNVEPSASR